MMRKTNIITRKAHKRKGFRRRDGTWVKPTSVKSTVYKKEYYFKSQRVKKLHINDPDSMEAELKKMTVAELRELAGPLLTEKEKNLRKKDLIEAIKIKITSLKKDKKWVEKKNPLCM